LHVCYHFAMVPPFFVILETWPIFLWWVVIGADLLTIVSSEWNLPVNDEVIGAVLLIINPCVENWLELTCQSCSPVLRSDWSCPANPEARGEKWLELSCQSWSPVLRSDWSCPANPEALWWKVIGAVLPIIKSCVEKWLELTCQSWSPVLRSD
jgi:hypothetical protein